MSGDYRAQRAAAEARRVGADFTSPDLDRTIRRRRRGRMIAAVSTSVLAIVVAVGAAAFLMRTETNEFPVDTTTTSIPDEAITTTTKPAETTTTTVAALPNEPSYGGMVTVGSGTDMVFGYQDVDGTHRAATVNPLLDPHNSSDVARFVVPGAFRIDPGTGGAKPWVVDSIPREDNGGVVRDGTTTTVTYQIDSKAAWADGTPISFEDFLFTHELIMNEDQPIDGELRLLHSLIDTGTLSGSGKTVTFELASPDPMYERLFPWLVPAHAVNPETFADDWNEALWLSGGPFVFDSYDPPTDSEREPGIIKLSRNSNYWEFDAAGNQLPYLDGVELRVFTPGSVMEATIASWFTTQSVDVMTGGTVSRYFVASLGDPEEEGFVLAQSWDSLYEVLSFEMRESRLEVNPGSLNTELLYRQAVLTAIDREAVAAETDNPVTSIAGAASPLLDVDVWDQYDDPGRTTALLTQLGESLGRDFAASPPSASLTSSPGDGTMVIGEAVANQLSGAGFEVTTDYTWDFFNVNLPEGRNDIFTMRMFAGDGLAELVRLLSYFDPKLPEDELLFGWSSVGEPAQRFADVMEEARSTLDRDRLRELLVEAETILADNAIVYPLVRRQLFFVPYWPDRVQGIVPHQGWDTATAAYWWSPEGARRN